MFCRMFIGVTYTLLQLVLLLLSSDAVMEDDEHRSLKFTKKPNQKITYGHADFITAEGTYRLLKKKTKCHHDKVRSYRLNFWISLLLFYLLL